MTELSNILKEEIPEAKKPELFWLGGTSYILRSRQIAIGLDLYLTNSCMQKDGSYNRMIPSPVKPEELELDYIISTHDHGDHFDLSCLKTLMESKDSTRLIGPTSVKQAAVKAGISHEEIIELNRGQAKSLEGLDIRAVMADHGEYAPDCIGVIMDIDGKRIYFTSDGTYRYDLSTLIDLGGKIDVLLVPINGKFGNPDPKEACYITDWVKPAKAIPAHFWMFSEHGGDPGLFQEYCKEMVPGVKVVIPAMGQKTLL
jgi:L-ascorbate 6-phosphate lactonase